MGRQAYLTKIALGRSAFEPCQTATQSSEYVQLSSSQQELPQEARDSNSNKYVQLYDERGNPINPRAHEHGRRLREAQNDVLASIGVVERRRSPSQDLPGSYEDRLQQLEDEDMTGRLLHLACALTENACTWWIGSLRERVLTFHFRDTLSFSRIIASERALSGRAIVHGGFTSRLVSTLSIQATIYAAFVIRPIDHLLRATRASGRTVGFFRQWRSVIKACLRISLEVLFYPLAYHSYLQRLGLVPAKPLLPPLRAFVPFSKSSPLLPWSLHHTAATSIVDFVQIALTSPFVFLCLERFYERWIYAAINQAIEAAVTQPDNADMPSRDDDDRNRATTILGLKRRSPDMVRGFINKLLVSMGWGKIVSSEVATGQELLGVQGHNAPGGHFIEVGGSQVTNINRLDLPLSRQDPPMEINSQEADSLPTPATSLSEVLTPPTPPLPPPSPTASQASHNDNDPRIRITSREGIVEMEVRLPPHILSSHTEIAGTGPPTPSQHDLSSPNPERTPAMRAYHRVTQLSLQPAEFAGAICRAQIVSWASLPLKLVTLRLVASQFLASRNGYIGPRRVLDPLPNLSDLTWRSIGVQLSRIALCGALEFAVDLSLWGAEYLAVAWLGTNVFGWGSL